MKAIFIFDTDKNEFGEAVAMITTEDYTTFLVRGVIRPLPQKVRMVMNEYYEGMADGWNGCIDKITGETNG